MLNELKSFKAADNNRSQITHDTLSSNYYPSSIC